jgi:signal transduction histidine kinase
VARSGLWLRVFVGLVLAVLPPLLILSAALLLTESVLRELDENVVAILVVVAAIAWAAILAVVYTRALSEDLRSMLSLARRGERSGTSDVGAAAYEQLASTLEERNRQVATLARQASLVPIDDDPRRVISALVSTVRSVMGDATWQFAVLTSENTDLLAPGVHHAVEEERVPDAVGDLQRWAAASASAGPVQRAEGPWGAFVVVVVSATDRLRAILYAPWEGRRDPSPAEVDLLTLVGQHAGTALEHSLLYARVRMQADELNRLAMIQADFLRGVTHDLQTPLTSIGALATELLANEHVPKSAQADLATITHQADRLRRMVSQLLVTSRLEAGAVVPRQEVFSIQPVIERTWKALRADRDLELSVEGEPHLVVADPDRTEQILWAVFDNAAKYSPSGSTVSVSVAPDAAGHLGISVRDQGTGMDAETRRRAFDQFYRSEQARALAPDGSGIGLYAARGLAEAMGGTITLESRLGAGTTVVVSLPAEHAGAERDGRPARAK